MTDYKPFALPAGVVLGKGVASLVQVTATNMAGLESTRVYANDVQADATNPAQAKGGGVYAA